MGSQIFRTEVGQYVNTDGANLLNGSKGPFKPDKKPANFDNNILYKDSTSIYMEQGQEYIVSAKTDGNFTAHHDGFKESDNVVLWIMDKDVRNYQIVSDPKTGTTGTKITWNKPTGTYHLRVNTYRKDPDKLKSVWNVKVEKGSIKSDYTLSLTDQLKADPLIEATRTQMTQLAGSWAVKNLNSNGDVLNSINVLADGTNRIDGRLTHITGQTVIDEAVIDSASLKKVSASKLSGGEADFAKMNVVNFDAKNVTSGTFKGLTFEGGRIKSLDGSLSMDLNNKKIRLNGDNVGIVREFKDYPTQFIRYEAQRENNQNHARTIIGSNRNGSEEWNSASFSGIVIDNNSNNGVDKLFQYGDYNYMRHASGDDGWNFSVVTQTLVPGTWNKNSEIWCRHFVIPKETKSDTDSPTKFIRLDDSVAALWKLWAHALGQIGMTEAMKNVIKGSLGAWSCSRPHI